MASVATESRFASTAPAASDLSPSPVTAFADDMSGTLERVSQEMLKIPGIFSDAAAQSKLSNFYQTVAESAKNGTSAFYATENYGPEYDGMRGELAEFESRLPHHLTQASDRERGAMFSHLQQETAKVSAQATQLVGELAAMRARAAELDLSPVTQSSAEQSDVLPSTGSMSKPGLFSRAQSTVGNLASRARNVFVKKHQESVDDDVPEIPRSFAPGSMYAPSAQSRFTGVPITIIEMRNDTTGESRVLAIKGHVGGSTFAERRDALKTRMNQTAGQYAPVFRRPVQSAFSQSEGHPRQSGTMVVMSAADLTQLLSGAFNAGVQRGTQGSMGATRHAGFQSRYAPSAAFTLV